MKKFWLFVKQNKFYATLLLIPVVGKFILAFILIWKYYFPAKVKS